MALHACSTKNESVIMNDIAIIPAPTSLQMKDGSFELNNKASITALSPELAPLAQFLSDEIKKQTGISLPVNGADKPKTKGIILTLEKDDAKLQALPQTYGLSPKDGNPADERYSIEIDKSAIRISASAAEGIFRGITSLKQIIGINDDTNKSIKIPALEIKDSPRFAWRGLSFDVSRMFYTVPEVKEVIDMLSLYKMNVLHIHLADNEGWRIEIKKYPNLTKIGAFIENRGRKGGFYTQEEFSELVRYAAERFVTVVPEIDMPGHTAAAFASYPELRNAVKIKTANNTPFIKMCALDPDDPYTMQFAEDVFTELAAITPGSYIHIGGDETFGMAEDKYFRFIEKLRPVIIKSGKKMVGWQESVRADIQSGDVIQYWMHMNMDKMLSDNSQVTSMIPKETLEILTNTFKEAYKDPGRAVSKNIKMIISPAAFVYLDFPYAEGSSDSTQNAEVKRLGMPFYPARTIKESWDWDPATFNPVINPENNVAGIEGAIWCETISSFSDVQFMLLPNLAGVAEKSWAKHETAQWDEYSKRLAVQAPFWNNMNWNYFKSSLIEWK